jgi:hypothetical protein
MLIGGDDGRRRRSSPSEHLSLRFHRDGLACCRLCTTRTTHAALAISSPIVVVCVCVCAVLEYQTDSQCNFNFAKAKECSPPRMINTAVQSSLLCGNDKNCNHNSELKHLSKKKPTALQLLMIFFAATGFTKSNLMQFLGSHP